MESCPLLCGQGPTAHHPILPTAVWPGPHCSSPHTAHCCVARAPLLIAPYCPLLCGQGPTAHCPITKLLPPASPAHAHAMDTTCTEGRCAARPAVPLPAVPFLFHPHPQDSLETSVLFQDQVPGLPS